MEGAIRRISVERGHDPREYALVSFGGAGGMHACELAQALDMRRVIVPDQPGLLSARGAIAARFQRDFVQTLRLVDPPPSALSRPRLLLEQRARREIRLEQAPVASSRIATFLDCRYLGQSHEISVPANRDYRARFHAAHQRLYGYADEAQPVEVVNLRVSASSAGPRLPTVSVRRLAAGSVQHRLRWNGRWLRARRLAREALPTGRRLAGPLIITEFSATTVVPPGWSARALATGDLLLERVRARKRGAP
jgi:N-methylhydantoinase A